MSRLPPIRVSRSLVKPSCCSYKPFTESHKRNLTMKRILWYNPSSALALSARINTRPGLVMKKRAFTLVPLCLGLTAGLAASGTTSVPAASGSEGPTPLERRFAGPPSDDRLAVYWFWSNTTDKASITADLEAMAAAGIGRAVLSLTNDQSSGNKQGGVVFLSPEFLERFRFALDEAKRVGIKITAIPSNGWYQGGPWVTPEMGTQMLAWSETAATGPSEFEDALPVADKFRPEGSARIARNALEHWQPVATLAFRQGQDATLDRSSMVDLSSKVAADGKLQWSVPEGRWVIYRFGHIPCMIPMKNFTPGYGGLQIDHMSRAAMERHWQEVAVPLLAAAGPHVGDTLDRLHEDSLELGHNDWTPALPAFFLGRKGYDLIPLLPALAGARFSDGTDAARINEDFASVLQDMLIEEHYGVLRALANQRGLGLIAETGKTGSGIKLKGAAVDHVMDEFWTHRGFETEPPKPLEHAAGINRSTVFAAQVYGQNRNSWEAFTSHQQWLETPAQLKALANEAFALGANHLTIHGFSNSPLGKPAPGDVYFAGTHFNPGVTWWKDYAKPLTAFFNRSQTMLTAGRAVSDLLYVDGPALAGMIRSNEMVRETDRCFWKFSGIPGDLLDAKAVVDARGRIVLPHGQTFAVLVVADKAVNLDTMRAVARLAGQGATVWLQEVPDHSLSFANGPKADAEIRALAVKLGAGRGPGIHPFGRGRVLVGADRSGVEKLGRPVAARKFYRGMHAKAMDQLGIAPAFSYQPGQPDDRLFFFQREVDGADVFFVANARRKKMRADCTFRVAGKTPEIWDPVTGEIRSVPSPVSARDSTTFPLELAGHESLFVVFREPADSPSPASRPAPVKTDDLPITGPWDISFDPAREGLESFQIKSGSLFRWDGHKDAKIATFSGTAAYRTTFEIPAALVEPGHKLLLDLGESPGLFELTGGGRGRGHLVTPDVYDSLCAEVLVNGKSAGVLWCAPYHLDVSKLVHPGTNELEIRVTNTWHNWRLANKFAAGTHPWEQYGFGLPPAPAGLLGPVQVEISQP
jgi:hypothetical protein